MCCVHLVEVDFEGVPQAGDAHVHVHWLLGWEGRCGSAEGGSEE